MTPTYQESPLGIDGYNATVDGGTPSKSALYQREWRKKNPERAKAHTAKYVAANGAKTLERHRLYRAKNALAIQIRNKEWRKANHVASLEHKRRWRKNNPEKVLKKDAAYRDANRERERARTLLWHKKNPQSSRQATFRRRARMAGGRVGDVTVITKWEKRWRRMRTVKCYWCVKFLSPKRCHTDHITPLSKGGPHSIENVCISCATCNYRKNDDSVEVWNKKVSQPTLL